MHEQYRRIVARSTPFSESRRNKARCSRCGIEYGTSEPTRRPTFSGLYLCPDCRKGDGEWFREKAGAH